MLCHCSLNFFITATTRWLHNSKILTRSVEARWVLCGSTPSSFLAMQWPKTQRGAPHTFSTFLYHTSCPVHPLPLCSFGLSLQGKNDQVKARAPVNPSFSLLGQSFSSHKAQPRLEPFPLFIFRLSYYAHNLDSLLFLHHNFPSFSAEAHTH